ncbi:MAG: hypothetical protein ACYC56_14005 [Candidatus Aquicultor sp.]
METSKGEEKPRKEHPVEGPVEDIVETEIAETRYMGEGPPGVGPRKDRTEVSETAYMGEPEKRDEPKHETEYNEFRNKQPHIGKATQEPQRQREKRKPA